MMKYLSLLAGVLLPLPLGAQAVDDAARSSNAFCFALWENKGAAEGNDVFSPFSVWAALAMTSAGAEADTLQQMQEVLLLPAEDPHGVVSGWSGKLGGSKDVEMIVANRLWGREGLPFRAQFLEFTKQQYGARLQALDFVGDADGSRQTINQWVSENTGGKIKNLIERAAIQGNTQLVLTNAIYFKGAWMHPFNPNTTRKSDFTFAPGKTTTVETMLSAFPAAYMENERLQAVRLPYQGSGMAMLLVLPKRVDALTEGPFLSAAGFADVLALMKDEMRVVVQLPRFEVSARVDLVKGLSEMGMSRAFADEAQFGRMCESPIKVSAVIHQAWIKVAEKGTEAAAATAVLALPAGMPAEEALPKSFIADHPFQFFVIDTTNGGIVFAGRVMDPGQ